MFHVKLFIVSFCRDMSQRESKDRRTLYCGNLHENVTDEILFELFLQVKQKTD